MHLDKRHFSVSPEVSPFSRSVISCVVRAYHRFALSLRICESLLAEWGALVSDENIRV